MYHATLTDLQRATSEARDEVRATQNSDLQQFAAAMEAAAKYNHNTAAAMIQAESDLRAAHRAFYNGADGTRTSTDAQPFNDAWVATAAAEHPALADAAAFWLTERAEQALRHAHSQANTPEPFPRWVDAEATSRPELEQAAHTWIGQREIEFQQRQQARDSALLAIAKKHLAIHTFQTQRSGADFQEQAVWCVEAALKAAYEAGRASK